MLAHYGAVADAARVADPNRKGTVESAIQHTQCTALKGRRFESLDAQTIETSINAIDSEDVLKYLPNLAVRKRFIGDFDHAVMATRTSGTNFPARSLVYADGLLLSPKPDDSKVVQGVTTEVTGNCGFTIAPVNPTFRDFLKGLGGRGAPVPEPAEPPSTPVAAAPDGPSASFAAAQ